MKASIVLVCGGRDWTNRIETMKTLDGLDKSHGPIEAIVEGGYNGADKLAAEWALNKGLCNIRFPAAWGALKKKAGPIRNSNMVKFLTPDLVYAFPGGSGTADMVKKASLKGIRVLAYNQEEAEGASERVAPTPEQKKKFEYDKKNPAEIDSNEQAITETLKNVTQTNLQRYWRRKKITDRQYVAGEQLWLHYYYANLEAGVTGRYEDAPRSSSPDLQFSATWKQMDHRKAYMGAMNDIGYSSRQCLRAMVIEDQSAQDYALSNGQPERSAFEIGIFALQQSLEALANHWNIGDNYKPVE